MVSEVRDEAGRGDGARMPAARCHGESAGIVLPERALRLQHSGLRRGEAARPNAPEPGTARRQPPESGARMNAANNPLYCACCREVRQVLDFTWTNMIRAEFCVRCLRKYRTASACQYRVNQRVNWRKPKLDMSVLGRGK